MSLRVSQISENYFIELLKYFKYMHKQDIDLIKGFMELLKASIDSREGVTGGSHRCPQ